MLHLEPVPRTFGVSSKVLILTASQCVLAGTALAPALAEISLGILVNIGAREQRRRLEPQILTMLVEPAN
jgi:hypothetical protein